MKASRVGSESSRAREAALTRSNRAPLGLDCALLSRDLRGATMMNKFDATLIRDQGSGAGIGAIPKRSIKPHQARFLRLSGVAVLARTGPKNERDEMILGANTPKARRCPWFVSAELKTKCPAGLVAGERRTENKKAPRSPWSGSAEPKPIALGLSLCGL